MEKVANRNEKFRNAIVRALVGKNPLRYLGLLLRVTPDKDFAIRRVLNVLAATQDIMLPQKDNLRKQIRNWYRANYGDRKFFADSDLHRKHRRVMV